MGLTWQAVDFDKMELTVGLQLQRVRRELLLRETKTEASDSDLPVPICVWPLSASGSRTRIASTPAKPGAWINEWDLVRLDPSYRPQTEVSPIAMGYDEQPDLDAEAIE
jgi:hypothetical protein